MRFITRYGTHPVAFDTIIISLNKFKSAINLDCLGFEGNILPKILPKEFSYNLMIIYIGIIPKCTSYIHHIYVLTSLFIILNYKLSAELFVGNYTINSNWISLPLIPSSGEFTIVSIIFILIRNIIESGSVFRYYGQMLCSLIWGIFLMWIMPNKYKMLIPVGHTFIHMIRNFIRNIFKSNIESYATSSWSVQIVCEVSPPSDLVLVFFLLDITDRRHKKDQYIRHRFVDTENKLITFAVNVCVSPENRGSTNRIRNSAQMYQIN